MSKNFPFCVKKISILCKKDFHFELKNFFPLWTEKNLQKKLKLPTKTQLNFIKLENFHEPQVRFTMETAVLYSGRVRAYEKTDVLSPLLSPSQSLLRINSNENICVSLETEFTVRHFHISMLSLNLFRRCGRKRWFLTLFRQHKKANIAAKRFKVTTTKLRVIQSPCAR